MNIRRNGIAVAEARNSDFGDSQIGLGAALAFLRAHLHLWAERRRARRAIARMSDHMLRDIGLTPGEALDEAAKPFWRA